MEQIFKSNSSDDTFAFGENFAKTLNKGDVIALFGEIGAGKTVFVKGIAKGLDLIGDVKSPTFTIVHEYHRPQTFYHFDMYRIDTDEEALEMGFYDYLNIHSICVIEWADKIKELLPKNRIDIYINKDPNGSNKRKIVVNRVGI